MKNFLSALRGEPQGKSPPAVEKTLEQRVEEIIGQAGEGFYEIGFRARSYRTGQRKTIFTSTAGDFYKTAEFVRGEHEARQLMARACARTGGRVKTVKICRPDAQTTVYLLGDVNRTLDFGHSRQSKLELMALCGATVCLSLADTQDLVKAALYANNSVAWTMTRAQNPNMVIDEVVANIIEPVESTGSLDSGLKEALEIVPPAGQCEVVVMSDFLNFTDAHYAALAELAEINNVRAVVIQDIRERELPPSTRFFPTRLPVFDMTTGKQVNWWLTESSRRKYTEEFERHEAALIQYFLKYNITYEVVRTDEGDASVDKVIGLLASPPLLS